MLSRSCSQLPVKSKHSLPLGRGCGRTHASSSLLAQLPSRIRAPYGSRSSLAGARKGGKANFSSSSSSNGGGPTTTTTTPPPKLKRASSITSGKRSNIEINDLSNRHGIRLTKTEQYMLRQQLDSNGDGIITRAELNKVGKKALEGQWERELCLRVIEQPVSWTTRMASRFLSVLDYGGTALFAIVGTQLAGEAGMNVVGCTLVGCITCLGGGSLNNVLYGSSAALLGRPGVFWVTTPSYLVTALIASMTTFFFWPKYCRTQAKQEMRQFIGEEHLHQEDGSVSQQSFLKACERNPQLAISVAKAFGKDATKVSSLELFQLVDTDGNKRIEISEMQAMVGKRFDTSPTIYALDTLALAAFAVVGVNGAIGRGLPPLVAATSGVTMCFGGILRDVMCHRNVAIGGQSYAFTTGAGAAMYVLLRELRLRGMPVPLLARMIVAFSTTVTLRVWEFFRGAPLLQAMHHEDE